ncbi:hypothetical protein CHS0354_026585 [Potamilus streckersoni]|uniref:Transposase Helix-turn-helix domain-containing protein n=1 Tax=Potamilus streckersoni TaxID=2493646 RepID=A0AAE0TJM0_9BIVA|nr:hypothetical protein CHS0354_026585 [Potamilus streckersoni]
MDDHQFHRHFRIGNTVCNLFLAEFADAMVRIDVRWDSISPPKQLLVFLWDISNLKSVRETSDLFGMSPRNAHGCTHYVARMMISSFSSTRKRQRMPISTIKFSKCGDRRTKEKSAH